MKTLGFAMTGSFCTFEKATAQLEALSHTYHILPLMSQNAYTTDTLSLIHISEPTRH